MIGPELIAEPAAGGELVDGGLGRAGVQENPHVADETLPHLGTGLCTRRMRSRSLAGLWSKRRSNSARSVSHAR